MTKLLNMAKLAFLMGEMHVNLESLRVKSSEKQHAFRITRDGVSEWAGPPEPQPEQQEQQLEDSEGKQQEEVLLQQEAVVMVPQVAEVPQKIRNFHRRGLVVKTILGFLNFHELLQARLVCREWAEKRVPEVPMTILPQGAGMRFPEGLSEVEGAILGDVQRMFRQVQARLARPNDAQEDNQTYKSIIGARPPPGDQRSLIDHILLTISEDHPQLPDPQPVFPSFHGTERAIARLFNAISSRLPKVLVGVAGSDEWRQRVLIRDPTLLVNDDNAEAGNPVGQVTQAIYDGLGHASLGTHVRRVSSDFGDEREDGFLSPMKMITDNPALRLPQFLAVSRPEVVAQIFYYYELQQEWRRTTSNAKYATTYAELQYWPADGLTVLHVRCEDHAVKLMVNANDPQLRVVEKLFRRHDGEWRQFQWVRNEAGEWYKQDLAREGGGTAAYYKLN